MIEVQEVGPDRAADVLEVILAGFGARELLDPPSTATTETLESVRDQLAAHGGLVATAGAGPAAAVLFAEADGLLALRRLAVHPDDQGRGLGRALIRRAERVAVARGLDGVRLTARTELPRLLAICRQLRYTEIGRHGTLVTFAKLLPVELEAGTAEEMRDVGARIARVLRAGDLVILNGGLGAGKTTLTQGLGAGLGVRGDVTSPTFVISRVHPPLSDGPPLVHVDAYRLGGLEELDDLDLDTGLEDAVTVVEWGADVAEGLAEDRLEVEIGRARAGDAPADGEGPDPRTVHVRAVGPRWVGAGLRTALTADGPARETA